MENLRHFCLYYGVMASHLTRANHALGTEKRCCSAKAIAGVVPVTEKAALEPLGRLQQRLTSKNPPIRKSA
jgi:hypothetical protein